MEVWAVPFLEIQCLAYLIDEFQVFSDSVYVHLKVIYLILNLNL